MSDILKRADGIVYEDIPADLPAPSAQSPPKQNLTSSSDSKNQDGFPAIIKCRWCGKTIATHYIEKYKDGINGKPAEIILNYEPCADCLQRWSTMVMIIEVTKTKPYRSCTPIHTEKNNFGSDVAFYPTGRHVGVSQQAARETIDPNITNGTIFFMINDMFNDIFSANFQTKEVT